MLIIAKLSNDMLGCFGWVVSVCVGQAVRMSNSVTRVLWFLPLGHIVRLVFVCLSSTGWLRVAACGQKIVLCYWVTVQIRMWKQFLFYVLPTR
jgi:hypothetical protein